MECIAFYHSSVSYWFCWDTNLLLSLTYGKWIMNKYSTIFLFIKYYRKNPVPMQCLSLFFKQIVITISRSFSRLFGFIFISIILTNFSFIFQIYFFPSVVKFILSHFQDQSPSTFLQMNLFVLRSLLFLQRQHAVLLL